MRKMSIGAKMSAIFVGLLLVAQGCAFLVGLSKIGQAFDDLNSDSLEGTRLTIKMNTLLGDRRVVEREHILASAEHEWSEAENPIAQTSQAYEKAGVAYEATIHDHAISEKKAAESLRHLLALYTELENKMVAESRASHDDAAQKLYRSEMKEIYDRAGALVDEIYFNSRPGFRPGLVSGTVQFIHL
jgi:hypothetical protein